MRQVCGDSGAVVAVAAVLIQAEDVAPSITDSAAPVRLVALFLFLNVCNGLYSPCSLFVSVIVRAISVTEFRQFDEPLLIIGKIDDGALVSTEC